MYNALLRDPKASCIGLAFFERNFLSPVVKAWSHKRATRLHDSQELPPRRIISLSAKNTTIIILKVYGHAGDRIDP